MNVFILAWRNLWRNKRRTLITLAAVFMAVFFSSFMTGMQEGTYSNMINNIVKFYSGYIQIHQKDYWETKSINDIFTPTDSLYQTINSVDGITRYTTRLESYSLISSGENTKGAAVMGIDPEKENAITNLSHWVDTGKYLTPEDNGVLVAVNLAKNLDVDIGDTLTLLSQGYHGISAYGIYPVRGILKFPNPELNNMAIYMTIDNARSFFSAPGMASSIVIMVSNYNKVDKINQTLNSGIGSDYSSMTWDEMQPEIVQMIEGDRAGGVIMKAILYILIGFTIFGTVIMMINERLKEIAITVAVGMQKHKVQLMLFFETLIIAFLGVIAGFLISFPALSILKHHPIPLSGELAKAYSSYGLEPAMFFSTIPRVFTNQVIIVFAITLVVYFYPLFKIYFLNIIKSLRA